MNKTQAQSWLDAYIEAWRTYDPASIQVLFSEDVEYSYHPYDDDPISGVNALIDSWLDDPDTPDSWEASYSVYAVDGDRLVATGWSRYLAEEGAERLFHNCFLIEFDKDGRCRKFTEFYMKEG